MTEIQWIRLQELSDFHGIERLILEEFAQFGLFEIQGNGEDCALMQSDLAEVECMIRLYRDLGVNFEGIEVIQQMRSQLQKMQEKIRWLEYKLAKYEQSQARQLQKTHNEGLFFEAEWYSS